MERTRTCPWADNLKTKNCSHNYVARRSARTSEQKNISFNALTLSVGDRKGIRFVKYLTPAPKILLCKTYGDPA